MQGCGSGNGDTGDGDGDGEGAGDNTGVRTSTNIGGSTGVGDVTYTCTGGGTVEVGKIQTRFRAVHLRVKLSSWYRNNSPKGSGSKGSRVLTRLHRRVGAGGDGGGIDAAVSEVSESEDSSSASEPEW